MKLNKTKQKSLQNGMKPIIVYTERRNVNGG
jgi:hypothetical protein